MSAKFPSAIATDADLLVAKNRAQTTLVGNLNASDTTFTLAADAFDVNVAVTIGSEIILILAKTGATVTNCTRGLDGTSAASHLSGVAVTAYIDAVHHNQLRLEVEAIETALGVSMANIPVVNYPIAVNKGGTNATTATAARASLSAAVLGANNDITSLSALSTPLSVAQGGTAAATLTGILQGNGTNPFTAIAASSELQYLRRKANQGATAAYEFVSRNALYAADYKFSAQTPGGSLSAGSNTITLSPVPHGVNGADSNHYLYISAGTGTAEAVLITGGTAVSGATSGTVIVTCANTHSGAWTIQSATDGIQEAIMKIASPGGLIYVDAGTHTIYAPIIPPYQYTVWIEGAGRSATVLSVDQNASTSPNGYFNFSPSQVTATAADSGGIKNLTLTFYQPDSTNVATYSHWNGVYIAGNNHVTVDNVIIERAWKAINSPSSTNGITIRNVGTSHFSRGVMIDECIDLLAIEHLHGWVYGLTSNQSTAFRAVGTGNYLLDLSQVDFGYLDGVCSDSGKFAILQKNGAGSVPLIVGTNIDLDTNGGWEQSNGCVCLSGVTASTVTGTAAFSISGGTLRIYGLDVQNDGSTTAVITYNPAQANAGFAAGFAPGVFIHDLHVGSTAEDAYIIYATSSGAFSGTGVVQVIGGTITKSPGVSYTKPLFVEQTGTGTIVYDLGHIKIASNGATTASAINFATANAHSVSFVDAPGGWNYTIPSTTRWFNNSGFASNYNLVPADTKISGTVSMSTLIPLVGPNYIASETGANNAIAGALLDAAGVAVPLAAGLKIMVKLAHTLQAGANTFALNGGSAKNIKSSRNVSNNIATAYAATGVITMIYDGTEWVDVSQ